LLGVPSASNGRGLREVGCLPDAGPGLAEVSSPGRPAAEIAGAGHAALWLVGVDPVVSHPGRAGWHAGMDRASSVICHAEFLTEGVREHANVVFPADAWAEKEGTIVHPDGRLQRLRPAIARGGSARPGWWVLAELARRLGVDVRAWHGPAVSAQVFEAVPFYAGVSLDAIGGQGLRWVEGEAASAWPAAEAPAAGEDVAAVPSPNGELRLGTFFSIWSAPEVAVSPALKFLVPEPRAELCPEDAQRLGLRDGERVIVGSDGATLRATVALRAAVPPGSVFVEGNRVEGPMVSVRSAAVVASEEAAAVEAALAEEDDAELVVETEALPAPASDTDDAAPDASATPHPTEPEDTL
jgi:NADH-quinone oxidoreductase subunit G